LDGGLVCQALQVGLNRDFGLKVDGFGYFIHCEQKREGKVLRTGVEKRK